MDAIKKLKPFINGEFVESKTNRYSDAFNPSTGEIIAKVPLCTPDEVELAVKSAKEAYPAGQTPLLQKSRNFIQRQKYY